MTTEKPRRDGVQLFLLTTALLSCPFYYLATTLDQRLSLASLLVAGGLMWSPGIAALLAMRSVGGTGGDLGWRWPAPRYLILALLFPLGTTLAAAGPRLFALFTTSRWLSSPRLTILWLVAGSLSVVLALGEELGWRGFLLPRLVERYGVYRAILLSGALWALWHYPLLLCTSYGHGSSPLVGLPLFTMTALALSAVFAWLRIRSRSLVPVALLHGMHNLLALGLLAPPQPQQGLAGALFGESGLLLCLFSVVAGSLALRQLRSRPTVTP